MAYDINQGRNGITAALMGNATAFGGPANNMPSPAPAGMQQTLRPRQQMAPPPGLSQGQPAAAGASVSPTGQVGAAPMQGMPPAAGMAPALGSPGLGSPGLGMPGGMTPGQLPTGINPLASVQQPQY